MGKRPNKFHCGNKPDEAKRAEAVRLYQTGLSIRQVGLLIWITFQAAHGFLKRSGVEMRQRGGNVGAHSRHRR